MKGIRMDIILRNNLLLQKMEEYGYYTNVSLSKACNVSQVAIGDIINLKIKSVFKKSGEYSSAAKRIADHFYVDPESIFPPELYKFDTVSKASVEVPLESIKLLNTLFDKEYENKMLHQDIEKVLSILPNRTQKIIRMKFFENLSNKEIGDNLGMSSQNIYGIIMSGLKKIKESEQAQHLLEYIS